MLVQHVHPSIIVPPPLPTLWPFLSNRPKNLQNAFAGLLRHLENSGGTLSQSGYDGVPVKWRVWTFPHPEVSEGLPGGGHNQSPLRKTLMSWTPPPTNFSFSYSTNLGLPISMWCCVLYTSSPTIPWHFPSVHSHSGGPMHWQIRGNEVSSTQFEALLWSWMWNSGSAPLRSSPAGKIKALSLKALYLCSLHGSLLSLNRFGVMFKSQLLQALTVNGHRGWKSKRNVSDISFYTSLLAATSTHQKL